MRVLIMVITLIRIIKILIISVLRPVTKNGRGNHCPYAELH